MPAQNWPGVCVSVITLSRRRPSAKTHSLQHSAASPQAHGPARDFCCTAIDAHSGEFKVWTRADHISLGAAVASSCAVPGFYPCISIAGRRYYDGGLRSATNADVAGDAEVVVLISVLPASALAPRGASAKNPLDAEVAQLRNQGAHVHLIVADAASRAAFGPNLMDARRRLAALEAGIAQGRALAQQLRDHW